MENLLIYFLKLTVCSGVMFLYYQLSLKDKTFHHYNRFYLLATMLVSIFLPLLKIEDFTIEVSNRIYFLLEQVQEFKNQKNNTNDHIYFRIIFSSLGLVSFFFVGKILLGIFRIQKLKSSFKKEEIKGINFYQTDLINAPFSYFRNLFWKDSITLDSDVGKQILKHEMVHIEQKHSIDKIFAEVITAVFWFNPFFYLIKKEISLIHEYLADNKAVEKKDTKAFAQMLLASHFSGAAIPGASPFLNSNLKKRLQMLQKPNTKFGYARRIMALPIVFTVAFAYLVNAKNKEITETNIEIEKAVAELKKDTISPKNETDRIVKLQEEKISKANEKLKIQSDKLKTLSEKSKEKAAELQKIAKEKGEKSYDFELKAKELKQLSAEMDKVSRSTQVFEFDDVMIDDQKIIITDLKSKFPKGENTIIVKGEKNLDLDKLFDSKEFKERLGFSEEKFKKFRESLNTPEFRENLAKVNRFYINGVGVSTDAKDVEKLAKVYSGTSPLSISPTIPRKELSKKEQRKLEKLAKERVEIESKLKEIRKEERDIKGNPWIVSVNAYPKKTSTYVATSQFTPDAPETPKIDLGRQYDFNYKTDLKSYIDENIKYYLNGKEIKESDFKNIDAKNVKSMTVKKNNTDNRKSGEIWVETK